MFREEQVFQRLAELAGEIDPDLAEISRALAEAFAGEDLQDLLLDYSRLFLGPFEILAKPYGSVWLEGDKVLMGQSTAAVRELYREGGFDLAEDFREVPDHIAAELEFLYLLNYQVNEALSASDLGALEQIKSLRKHLLQEHLGRWVSPFTSAMEQGAQSRFYRLLAKLTKHFVQRQTTLAAQG
ncbi:hypothetical protein DESUT3_07730 [Desulfuromonas versatilis]|uniref:Molecular chaperone TorD n=2 Tax=Desulfuromonas versatilis TaxID=2802975 RepID=A0ABM8HPP6_9BACT|nr:hypothetical protein DESUT3_07730 [Desulfuromonas versatilis]